jgi:hypothetical protein
MGNGNSVGSSPKSVDLPRAYRPSWIDRFSAWVDRLPGQRGWYYFGIGLILFLIQTVVAWIEGALPVGTFLLVHGLHAGATAYVLALVPFLDRRASRAFASLRPALKADEQQVAGLHDELTTLPALPTLLFSLIIVAGALLLQLRGDPESFDAVAGGPVSGVLLRVVYYGLWWVFCTLIFHTIHQLRVINRIYTNYVQINPFRLGPLYAFSGVTAFTAVGMTIPPYAWMVGNPDVLQDLVALGIISAITVLAVFAFVWPLLGGRRLLAEEKGRKLDECSQRLEKTLADLHARVDKGELEGIGTLNSAITTLQTERDLLNGVSTWPWQPETVRLLVTALLLPLVLWIVQYLLQHFVGP